MCERRYGAIGTYKGCEMVGERVYESMDERVSERVCGV